MEDRAMTGVRILSVVTLGSLHWTRAVGQGVVTDFVLVDSGSDAVWLRLPESVAGLSAKRDLFAPGLRARRSSFPDISQPMVGLRRPVEVVDPGGGFISSRGRRANGSSTRRSGRGPGLRCRWPRQTEIRGTVLVSPMLLLR